MQIFVQESFLVNMQNTFLLVFFKTIEKNILNIIHNIDWYYQKVLNKEIKQTKNKEINEKLSKVYLRLSEQWF